MMVYVSRICASPDLRTNIAPSLTARLALPKAMPTMRDSTEIVSAFVVLVSVHGARLHFFVHFLRWNALAWHEDLFCRRLFQEPLFSFVKKNKMAYHLGTTHETCFKWFDVRTQPPRTFANQRQQTCTSEQRRRWRQETTAGRSHLLSGMAPSSSAALCGLKAP